MLSLLSLLLTSGTVLHVDTGEWTPSTYPDPRTNAESCNTWLNSTLCDPDHILTDQWRADIDGKLKHIQNEVEKVDIQYTDLAPASCSLNASEPIKIYLLLAKRIRTSLNESMSHSDLTTFGDEVLEAYELNDQECKNFLLLIGVQTSEVAYVRTGKDLKLPSDMMERIFSQSTKLFSARNYMENLSKIIENIGSELLNLFKDESTNAIIGELKESTVSVGNDSTETTTEVVLLTTPSDQAKASVVTWIMIAIFGIFILFTIIFLGLQYVRNRQQQKPVQTQTVVSANSGDLTSSPQPQKRSCLNEDQISEDNKSQRDEELNPYLDEKSAAYEQTVVDETNSSQSHGTETNTDDCDEFGTNISTPNDADNDDESGTPSNTPEDSIQGSPLPQRPEDPKPRGRNFKVLINPLDLSTDFIKSLSPFKSFSSTDSRVRSKL